MRTLKALRKDLSALWNWLKDAPLVASSVVFYLFVAACDWCSTLFAQYRDPHAAESNPFVRDTNMHLVLHKAFTVDFLYLIVLTLGAVMLWKICSVWSLKLADCAVAILFAYTAYERLGAVFNNILFGLRFYVADPNAGIMSLFGLLKHF